MESTCESRRASRLYHCRTRYRGVFRPQGPPVSSSIAHRGAVSPPQLYRSKRGSGARNLARARRSLPGDATSIWRYSSGLPCVSKLSEMRARPARGTAVHDEEGRYLYPHPGRSRVSKSETLLNKRSATTTGAPPERPSATARAGSGPQALLNVGAPSPTALARGPRPVKRTPRRRR